MTQKKATVFNATNDGYLTKKYPLFLGQPLGLYDSINIAYPVLHDNYKHQMSFNWNEEEINLDNSRMDLMPHRSKPEEVDLMVKTLANLWELDSVASRSIIGLFGKFITNSELSALMTEWSRFEVIHALTYSEIIRNCIGDPIKAVEEVVRNENVLGRSDLIVETLDNLSEAGDKYGLGLIHDGPELKKIILKGLVAVYLLERIQFMSSFAVIFGMAETGRYEGIAKLVQLIARDEGLHARFTVDIVSILREDKDWDSVYVQIIPELEAMVDEIIEREFRWNEYLFSEGRQMVGLNTTLLNEYTLYSARDVTGFLGLQLNHPLITKLPMQFMTNWLEMDRVQVAPQESDLNNYKVGVITSDDEGEIFDI